MGKRADSDSREHAPDAAVETADRAASPAEDLSVLTEDLSGLGKDRAALYDARSAREIRKDGPAPRPRDAATLILVRRDGPAPLILLGRRASGHAFMPDKYVFPGGRVDADDWRAPVATPLRAETRALLSVQSRRPAEALAVAAIRETFEETGLLVARPGRGLGAMGAMGVSPHLAPLRFIARAVTPPYRTRRFDARFFLAYADEALIDDRPLAADGGELGALAWLTLAEAQAVDLPNVTRFVLREVGQILDPAQPDPRPPFLRWKNGDHSLVRL